MKILLIHQFFILENEPGGSRHVALLRYFQKQGHAISVIAGSANYMTNRSKLPFGKLFSRQTVDGIKVTWIYAFPSLFLGLPGKLLSFFSFFLFSLPILFLEKPDLVIATSPPPFAAFLGWLESKIRKIPWIFEVRDLWPDTAADLGILSRGKLYDCLEKSMRFLYRRCSHVVTLTWGLEKAILNTGIPPEKITTIPNGVDDIFENRPDFDSPELNALRAQGRFLIVYTGAMGRANDLELVFSLASRLLESEQRIQFVLVGDGPRRKQLEKMAIEQNLSNVAFLGSIPRSQIPSLLACADAGIITLAKGSFARQAISNKFFDYLAAAVPVLLAIEPGDASEILNKARGGVRIDPENFEAMKAQLIHWVEHPEEARKTGMNGKAYVMQHFLRKDLSKKYLLRIEAVQAAGDSPHSGTVPDSRP